MSHKTKNKKENRLPDILINVENKSGVTIIDFQRQPTGDPMKVYISRDGVLQIVQNTDFGVDTVRFDVRCLAALLKALGVDWENEFERNFSLHPQKYGKKV